MLGRVFEIWKWIFLSTRSDLIEFGCKNDLKCANPTSLVHVLWTNVYTVPGCSSAHPIHMRGPCPRPRPISIPPNTCHPHPQSCPIAHLHGHTTHAWVHVTRQQRAMSWPAVWLSSHPPSGVPHTHMPTHPLTHAHLHDGRRRGVAQPCAGLQHGHHAARLHVRQQSHCCLPVLPHPRGVGPVHAGVQLGQRPQDERCGCRAQRGQVCRDLQAGVQDMRQGGTRNRAAWAIGCSTFFWVTGCCTFFEQQGAALVLSNRVLHLFWATGCCTIFELWARRNPSNNGPQPTPQQGHHQYQGRLKHSCPSGHLYRVRTTERIVMALAQVDAMNTNAGMSIGGRWSGDERKPGSQVHNKCEATNMHGNARKGHRIPVQHTICDKQFRGYRSCACTCLPTAAIQCGGTSHRSLLSRFRLRVSSLHTASLPQEARMSHRRHVWATGGTYEPQEARMSLHTASLPQEARMSTRTCGDTFECRCAQKHTHGTCRMRSGLFL